MIDFDDCSIRSFSRLSSTHTSSFSSHLREEVLDITRDKAIEVDELISDEKYDEAIDVLDSMIGGLEDIKEDVRLGSPPAYKMIYDEVTNKSYHSRIVNAAREHDKNECIIGALKSVRKELEENYC